jgi:uridine nucleosidase
VLNAPVPKTMIPLNVSHKAIVTSTVHAKLMNSTGHDTPPGAAAAGSQLRYTLSTVVSSFKEAYQSVFGFMDGPPLHDPLTIAYVSKPELFTIRRYRVDVELTGAHSSGQTVADVYGYQTVDDTWGRTGKNCEVATDLDVCTVHISRSGILTISQVAAFFELFLDCATKCDEVSPLNLKPAN